jgi:hypothetical protein
MNRVLMEIRKLAVDWRIALAALMSCCLAVGCSGPTSSFQAGGARPAGTGDRAEQAPPTRRPTVEAENVESNAGIAAANDGRTHDDATSNPGGISFVDALASSQIRFRHTDGGSGRRYIVETVVAGLALFDYDGDSLVDIYFLNGAPLPGAKSSEPPRNALYRNNGDWTFTDVTAAAGVGDTGYGLGVTAGDFDNDGDQDLYVNNFGPNVFYVNNGDGTFSEAADRAQVACDKVGAGAAFLDIEGDGDLDLYVANYVKFTFDKHKTRTIGKYEFPPGPTDYDPEPDVLFRNNGDGTFTDISQMSRIGAVAAPGMGLVCADYDDDGDTDVFVCSDNAPNLLFQNDGSGKFQEVGVLAGAAFDLDGGDNGNMGVDCGDYDNDGRLDFFVTTYQAELAVLYRNLGGGLFLDATRVSGVGHNVGRLRQRRRPRHFHRLRPFSRQYTPHRRSDRRSRAELPPGESGKRNVRGRLPP